MWKREEAPRPPQPAVPPTAPSPPVVHQSTAPRVEPVQPAQQEKAIVNIGKSVIIKGELSGSEDLTIEGQVEGKIELRQNVLTIGPNAKIKAQVLARAVVVEGSVQGNIASSEKIEIRDKGSVEGDLSSPRVAIADGAHFRGSIDMQQAKGAEKHDGKPAAAAAPAPTAAPAQPAPVPAPVSVAR
jgi:cytoskeletal protein CcmA (bactofilin family)